LKIFQAILSLAFLLISNLSHAASVEWWFTNSGQNWLPTDTIVMEATLTNTDVIPLELGNLDSGINGAGLSHGTFYAEYLVGDFEFSFTYDEVLIPFTTVQLLPGESIDFVFGEFIPKTNIDHGFYQIAQAELVAGTQFNSNNLFNATVVPVPAALWLFSSGLIALVGLAKRK